MLPRRILVYEGMALDNLRSVPPVWETGTDT